MNLTSSGTKFPIEISFSFFLLTLIGMIGNLLIIFLIGTTQRLRKPVNYFILNLCFASIFFMMAMTARCIEDKNPELFYYSEYTCAFTAIAYRVPMPIMALTTTAISLDRSKFARSPLGSPSNNSSILIKILIIWGFSVAFIIPRVFMYAFDPLISEGRKCKKILMFQSIVLHTSYIFLYGFIIHIAPALVLFQEATRMWTKIKFMVFCKAENGDVSGSRRLRLVKNACVFTTIFLICWLPIGIVLLPYDLPPQIISEERKALFHFIYKNFVFFFGYFVVCLTPAALFILSQNLRASLLCSS